MFGQVRQIKKGSSFLFLFLLVDWLQLRGLHCLLVVGEGDALEADELAAEGEGPDKPHLELLLCDDPEVFVADAVEQQVDRAVERQEDVGHHRQRGHPVGPRVHQPTVAQVLEQKKKEANTIHVTLF